MARRKGQSPAQGSTADPEAEGRVARRRRRRPNSRGDRNPPPQSGGKSPGDYQDPSIKPASNVLPARVSRAPRPAEPPPPDPNIISYTYTIWKTS